MKKIRNMILILSIFTFTFVSTYHTIAYLIAEASPVIGTFIPNKNPTNDLIISAPVEHNLGTNYEIPDNIYFEYEVILGTVYSGKTIETSSGDLVADSTGTIKVKIPANSDIHIYELDETMDITINYLNTMPGFSVENDIISTKIPENGEVSFVTKYEPTPVSLSEFTISGEKVLETRDWVEEETFTFNLEMYVDGEWISLGTDTITYDSTNPDSTKFDLSEYLDNIKLDNVGEYKFRMTEVINSDQEITDFDNIPKNVTVIVTDNDMDGKLEIANVEVGKYIELIKENDTYKLEVTFNNAFSVYDLVYEDKPEDSFLTEDIVVVKNDAYDIETVIDNFDGLSEDYTYKLYDKDGNELNSTLVRTGDYVLINSNNQEYKYFIVLKGDVTGDGEIAPIDYVKIKNHIMEEKIIEEGVYRLAADYNDDDGITPLDYVKVKNHIMNGGN